MAGFLFRLETAAGSPPTRPRSKLPCRSCRAELGHRRQDAERCEWLVGATTTQTDRRCSWSPRTRPP